MNLLTKIGIKNFKCFRSLVEFPLSRGTYFIGVNNAGKTAVLNAINFFFDDSLYTDSGFLNRTEYLAKKAGYNKTEISISFDLREVESKLLKSRLIKLFNNEIGVVKKIISYTPDSHRITSLYEIDGKTINGFDGIDEDIKKLIKSVKITYIHPQEGRELLLRAQTKLRERLLANWGRGAKLSHSIKELQEKWDVLRGQAKTYLSASLTENLQKMWPGSQASIDLPKNIKEIVGISDINFKSNANFPEIELNLQGTGAQSAILYLAHFLLDSDRSLHRGEYHPIWLLEEPESFLHADLIFKFATEINSESWLKHIQILASTHSPIILASSRLGGEKIVWNLIQSHGLKESKGVEQWREEEIEQIGKMMGDSNFQVYFTTARTNKLVFIEDKRPATKEKFEESGIKIEKSLDGVPQIARYLDVLLNSPDLTKNSIYFIVDNDAGLAQLSRFLPTNPSKTSGLLNLYKVIGSKKLYLVVLPNGETVEDLFAEFDNHLDNCVSQIWDTSNWTLKTTITRELSRAYSRARSRNDINSLEKARALIRSEQDIKDTFWSEVAKRALKFDSAKIQKIKALIAD